MLCLDPAASEFYKDGAYVLAAEGGERWDAARMAAFYGDLARQYPIVSIEDGMAEDDWEGWSALTAALGITALAYVLARRNADNPLFSFGPGKIVAGR